MTTYERSLWVKALTAHSLETIYNLAEEIGKNWQIKDKVLPQTHILHLTRQSSKPCS
ncbi:hypothetical protein [Crocosphaera sp. Alani8]|uniref:hypothetical protein n=1 Tax=Crocosphaera sp. Alani8 TaxID=3038952 RepID=UPI00313C0675